VTTQARQFGRLFGAFVNHVLGPGHGLTPHERHGTGASIPHVRPSGADPGPVVHYPSVARMARIDAEWQADNV